MTDSTASPSADRPAPTRTPAAPASASGAAIELADAIASLRDQLVDAATRATDRPVVFDVGDIEMEFTIEMRRETTGEGKVRAWVLDAGAGVVHGTGRAHRIALTLTPRNARTGAGWLVGSPGGGDTGDFGGTRPSLP
ncbi:trypco2 family protein [Streptomyces sp. NPDC020965]|uniref:trypco2 family protein n=1 Tax=Streptomyces sp. NPDC020965 TaxID=3365105 RepID=UPI0037BA2CF0